MGAIKREKEEEAGYYLSLPEQFHIIPIVTGESARHLSRPEVFPHQTGFEFTLTVFTNIFAKGPRKCVHERFDYKRLYHCRAHYSG